MLIDIVVILICVVGWSLVRRPAPPKSVLVHKDSRIAPPAEGNQLAVARCTRYNQPIHSTTSSAIIGRLARPGVRWELTFADARLRATNTLARSVHLYAAYLASGD